MVEEHIEFEETFPQMTDAEAAELRDKVDWGSTEEDSVPKVGGSAEETEYEPTEEQDTQDEGEQPEVDSGDVVEYELPDGTKLTAQELEELRTYEKRFKDTQADYTRIAQERSELARELTAMRFQQNQQPMFQPQYNDQPFKPQQLEDVYATDTERRLAEQLQGVQGKLQQIEYNNWQREQAELRRRADDLIDNFRTKHSDLPDDKIAEVLKRANDSGTYDLELVYNGMRDIDAERETIRKQAREELMADLRKKGKAKLEPGTSPSKEPPPLDVSKLSDDQVEALMMAEAKELFKG